MKKSFLYTIPATLPFADTLAAWVLERYENNPLTLSSVLILLPTRRSCLTLRAAFLRASKGKPLLLPRMQPVSDVDENRLLAAMPENPLPPLTEYTAMKRLFLLARLVQAKDKSRLDHALRLAQELVELLDEMEREEVPVQSLLTLAPEEFSEHWQMTAEFLRIIAQALPLVLEQEGIITPASRRNQILEGLSLYWRKIPPAHPVIVAGVTGSIPATAHLMETVAGLENGALFFPGFDMLAEEEYYEAIGESHPMAGMKKLLAQLGCEIQDIRDPWHTAPGKARLKLLSEIMRPAEVTDYARQPDFPIQEAVQGLKIVTCAHLQEEATVISLILRETLEHAGRTAALVTNDRTLARRVVACMQRFGVKVDDSGGVPLGQTPLGSFMRLIAEVAETHLSDTVKLLALLKHPLCRAGLSRAQCLETAREFEVKVARAKATHGAWRVAAEAIPSLNVLMKNLDTIFAPFSDAISTCQMSLITSAHLETTIALAGSDALSSKEGEMTAELIQEIRVSAGDISVIGSITYTQTFEFLLRSKTVRPEYGTHPRLKILSPIEARLQSYDVMIIGGLNESSFPADVPPDAWINRAMRRKIGLPSPENEIALAAHDFYTLAGAKEVYFTRAQKIGGAPSAPSRWLLRLDVLLSLYQVNIEDNEWMNLARSLDRVPIHPMARPYPRPPLFARPKALRVTEIETLLRNPYAIYARHILCLEPLPPLMRDAGAQDFGIVLHKALEEFVLKYSSYLPENALEILMRHGAAALEPFMAHQRVRLLWQLRFKRIAVYFLELEKERRPLLERIWVENKGTLTLDGFTLSGRADRIERLKDGSLCIIDYKTGAVPTILQLEAGLAPQLFLLAMLKYEKSRHQENIEVPNFQTSGFLALEYWRLTGGREAGSKLVIPVEKIPYYLEQARAGLKNILARCADPSFAYIPVPILERARAGDDYNQLARVGEWD